MNRKDEIQLADLMAMREASRLYKPYANNNPLKQPSEAQGRGLKRFFVGLLEGLRNL